VSNQNDGLALALVSLVRLVFSLLFPLILITLCGVSYLLATRLGLPQFGLWGALALWAMGYAGTHAWAAVGLIALVLLALPLAWVALKEEAARASAVIGAWATAVVFSGFTYWLSTVWPYDGSMVQGSVLAFFLLGSWIAVCEAVLGTLKALVQLRPQPGPEEVIAQKAHGDARVAGEAEALALLNAKK
jgi:hypothetical protein